MLPPHRKKTYLNSIKNLYRRVYRNANVVVFSEVDYLTVTHKTEHNRQIETNCLNAGNSIILAHRWRSQGAWFKCNSNLKRAVQMEILHFEAHCSKNTKIRGAQFKCKNNILTPSIGKNLQHLFLLYHQSCTESLRETLFLHLAVTKIFSYFSFSVNCKKPPSNPPPPRSGDRGGHLCYSGFLKSDQGDNPKGRKWPVFD
jgi:hypothetical protein